MLLTGVCEKYKNNAGPVEATVPRKVFHLSKHSFSFMHPVFDMMVEP